MFGQGLFVPDGFRQFRAQRLCFCVEYSCRIEGGEILVELRRRWSGADLEWAGSFFCRTRWRLVALVDSRLARFTQNRLDAIQFVEQKNVGCASSELNRQLSKMIIGAEGYLNYSVQRIFGDINNICAAEFSAQHLAEHIQRDRLFFQVLCAAMN